MKCISSGAAVVLLVACCINEALSFKTGSRLMSRMKMRLHSRTEIMANMTTERAAHIFLGMNKTRSTPELVSLIQARLGHRTKLLNAGKLQKLERTLLRAGKKKSQPEGYAALKPATDMLNSMMQEATMKCDTSEQRCGLFERRQYLMMDEAQADVSSFNSFAASARGSVLKAQAFIGELGIKIPNTQEELDEHRRSCKSEITTLKYQLMIMNGDIAVMDKILKMTDCSSSSSSTSQLIQTQSLVSCAECNNGDGVIMLQHDGIQPLLQQLKSQVAREFVQDHLSSAYSESAEEAAPVALTQEQVHHQMALVKSSLVHHHHVHSLVRSATVRRHSAAAEPTAIKEVPAGDKEKFTAGDVGEDAMLPQAGLGKVEFDAAADGSDIIVGLFPSSTIPSEDNKFLDFVFGGWGNTKHVIRLGAQGPILAEAPGSLELELGKPIELFVSVDYATGEVSMGDLTGTLVTFKATSEEDVELLQSVKYFGVSGWEKQVQLYSAEGGNLPLKQAEVPTAPEPFDCVPTTKCTLTPGSCNKLQEQFENAKGGIEDKRDETMDALVKLERYCEDTDKSLSMQLVQLGDRLRDEQTNLAVSTKDQIDSEQQAEEKGQQHEDLQEEYQTMMQKCCDEQNEQRSELCALEKIRGELYNMEGERVFITDCAVSSWNVEQCSVTCGGGTRKMFREIAVHPIGLGMPCPPLQMEEDCNEQLCPVDCELEDWGGWSTCSAECGGGVRSRVRSVRVEMKHGGKPCDDTEEAESCNLQSCNKNCELAAWGGWSACNKQCGGGHRSRTKAVAEREKGTGKCPGPQGVERLHSERCNAFSCVNLLPRGRHVLQCASKVDVIILLDSTGSLGSHGWEMSKAMAVKLVEAFNGVGGDFAKVSLALFGRKVEWISHLNTGTTMEQVKGEGVYWMRSVTYTHTALAMAEQELINGRDDANSVVIVITDGQPSRPGLTQKAAKKLQEKTRVLWVPVGRNAPIDLIKKMATSPKDDHIVRIQDFDDMDKPNILNDIVADTCPYVM